MEHMVNLSALHGLFGLYKILLQTDSDKQTHFYVFQLVGVLDSQKLNFI